MTLTYEFVGPDEEGEDVSADVMDIDGDDDDETEDDDAEGEEW